MSRSRDDGSLLIDALIAMSVIALLSLIAVNANHTHREEAFVTAMKVDLRSVANMVESEPITAVFSDAELNANTSPGVTLHDGPPAPAPLPAALRSMFQSGVGTSATNSTVPGLSVSYSFDPAGRGSVTATYSCPTMDRKGSDKEFCVSASLNFGLQAGAAMVAACEQSNGTVVARSNPTLNNLGSGSLSIVDPDSTRPKGTAPGRDIAVTATDVCNAGERFVGFSRTTSPPANNRWSYPVAWGVLADEVRTPGACIEATHEHSAKKFSWVRNQGLKNGGC